MDRTSDDAGRGAEHSADVDPLLQELHRIAGQFDPQPEGIRQAAAGSLAWRRIDAELAELTFDSAEAQEQLAGVRGGAAPRLLSFAASASVSLEVEVAERGPRHRQLLGQVVPPGPATIAVRYPAGSMTVRADQSGMFAADDVPAGPVSLRCQPAEPGLGAVQTDWTIV